MLKYDIKLLNFNVINYKENIKTLDDALEKQRLNFCDDINYEKCGEFLKEKNTKMMAYLNNVKLEPYHK